jgi:hypothetical protein
VCFGNGVVCGKDAAVVDDGRTANRKDRGDERLRGATENAPLDVASKPTATAITLPITCQRGMVKILEKGDAHTKVSPILCTLGCFGSVDRIPMSLDAVLSVRSSNSSVFW